MEIAIATQTAPSQWWDESAATLATAIQILNEQAETMERKGKRGR